jgi:hypothetical protein
MGNDRKRSGRDDRVAFEKDGQLARIRIEVGAHQLNLVLHLGAQVGESAERVRVEHFISAHRAVEKVPDEGCPVSQEGQALADRSLSRHARILPDAHTGHQDL